MKYAIEATGLVKRYKSVVALDGLDLAVPEGTVTSLLGPNCAGKTTAVRIFTTLIIPDAGQARVGGLDVVADADELRQMIGLSRPVLTSLAWIGVILAVFVPLSIQRYKKAVSR